MGWRGRYHAAGAVRDSPVGLPVVLAVRGAIELVGWVFGFNIS